MFGPNTLLILVGIGIIAGGIALATSGDTKGTSGGSGGGGGGGGGGTTTTTTTTTSP